MEASVNDIAAHFSLIILLIQMAAHWVLISVNVFHHS